MPSLVERLGYPPDAKLAIINCDDLGSSHSANVATFEALNSGVATSATLMVPCPWAREVATRYQDEDIGIHLTLNCEYDSYRWGPMTKTPSLMDEDGSFHRTIEYVWEHAVLDEVRRECHMQIERAISWGIDVSHLDSHVGHMMQRRPEFFSIYLEMALEFRVPVRLTGAWTEGLLGFPFRKLAEEAGVVGPDELVVVMDRNGVGSRDVFFNMLGSLGPGVHELYVHPAVDTEEIRSMTEDWKYRVDDYELVVNEPALRDAFEEAGVQLIDYRLLRDLMRSNPG